MTLSVRCCVVDLSGLPSEILYGLNTSDPAEVCEYSRVLSQGRDAGWPPVMGGPLGFITLCRLEVRRG